MNESKGLQGDVDRSVPAACDRTVRASRWRWFAPVVLSSLAAAAHAAPGRTLATPAVSPTGEAVYSIPFVVPPGTRGLTPQLGLAYGHRSGSSLAGVGWSVAGLSAMHRCGMTWAQDGAARDIRNDALDRFCLDGNRLRLVAGTYGLAGSEYRTELESFARVRAFGVAGNGPASFTVERKDGLVYEYGTTADSRIESQGQSTVRTWALSRVRDRSGNAIDFGYVEDTANGSYRISRVQYTGNATQGVAPPYEIRFTYESKPAGEVESVYEAGSVIREVTRLDRVEVLHAGQSIRRYELTHESAAASTGRSRLASLQECAGAECLQPTVFRYQDGTAGFNAELATGAAVPAPAQAMPLDVNGDGREDLVYPSSATSGAGVWMVMLATASGYGAPISSGIANLNHTGAIPIDYDADGRDDLLVPYSGGTWWVMLGHAGGLAAPSNTGAPVTATGSGVNARALDVNGDGLDDLVWADLVGYSGGDAIRYRLREWGGAFSAAVYTLAGPLQVDERITAGPFANWTQKMPGRAPDYNGDGRDDVSFRQTMQIVEPGLPTTVYYSIVVVCQGGTQFGAWSSNAASESYFGDFNGDGKSDIFYYDSSGRFRYRFSRGTSFGPAIDAGSIAGYSIGWVIVDWDGDGYDDVLAAHTTSGTWHLMRSNGESLAAFAGTGISSAGSSFATVTDVDGDGLKDLAYASGGAWRYRLRAGVTPDLLVRATDGHGNVVSFTYAALADAAYTRYTDAAYPAQDYAGSLSVATGLSASDGAGGTYTESFTYFGARSNLQGRGFEGFYARLGVDSRDGVNRWSYYNRGFPLTGTPNRIEIGQSNGLPIERTYLSWGARQYGSGSDARFLPHLTESTLTRYAVGGSWNGSLLSTERTTPSIDWNTGSLASLVRTTTEASTANGIRAGATWREETQFTDLFTDTSGDNWCVGRAGLVQQVMSHDGSAGQAQTRRASTTWDGRYCRPSQVVLEPGDAKWQVTIAPGYDAFGNPTGETVTGAGMAARTRTVGWDGNGQRPITLTNALGHLTRLAWDAALGLPSGETDPNGLQTTWTSDAFGRRTRETRPDGTSTTWSYADCSVAGCSGANHRSTVTVEERDTGNGVIRDERVSLDRFDRTISTSYRLLNGGYAESEVEYDGHGRVQRRSAPCTVVGCIQYWTTYTYDVTGRLLRETRPRSELDSTPVTTALDYQGLTLRLTDVAGKVTTRVVDAAGRMARSSDASGYALTFEHDGFGNLVEVIDSLGNTLQSDLYNALGLKTSSYDSDRGSWSYGYDALGELVQQTDANGRKTTWTYDPLGRPLTRVMPEGTGKITSTWTWGSSASAREIGQLKQAQISGTGLTTYREVQSFDALGRPSQTQYVEGSTSRYVDLGYSATTGLPESLTYPTSTSGYRLKLRYRYQNGLLSAVEDFNAASTVYWQANATDARGAVVDETLGNGVRTTRDVDAVTGLVGAIRSGPGGGASLQNLAYQWDAAGNLTQRQDLNQGLGESFTYDDLHRLTRIQTGSSAVNVSYDSLGNIASKGGVGSYAYQATRLHAVTQVTPASGPAKTYAYDANGNMTSRAGTELTWFASNLPKRVRATPGSAANSSEFQYTADGRRWRHKYNSGGTTYTHVSIGGLLEKVTQGSTIDYRHAIHANGQVVALYSRKSTGTNTTRYLLRDHLGSVDVVSSSSGAPVLRESFDAYGERRGANWTGVPTGSELATMRDVTRRGFTDHEHLDSTSLVHMNGRVYDPQLGRFASADPVLQAPYAAQGRNRYSYVADNPLRHVDPSGYAYVNLHVAFVDWGRGASVSSDRSAGSGQGAELSSGQATVARGVLASVFGAIAPPIGILIALTWDPNSQGGPAPSASWLNMLGPAGMSAGRETGGGRASSPRAQQQTERRSVADGALARDFPGVAISASAVHVFLDVVSATSVPIAAEIAGRASGAWYAWVGDWVGGGMSLAGTVPVLGIAADGAQLARGAKSVNAFLRRIEKLDVSTPRNSAVFYSGPGSRVVAEQFARSNGRMTLEMTPGGAWLDAQKLFGPDSPLTAPEAVRVWSRLSERFASQASGTAFGFVSHMRSGSIFGTVEYPALLSNPKIENVITGGQ